MAAFQQLLMQDWAESTQ